MIAVLTAQSQTMTLLLIGAGVMLLMLALRVLGLYLAHTHPDSEPAKTAPQSALAVPSGERDPEIVAIIAAATAAVIDQPFRIVAVSEPKKPSIESLMQVWSWEGRRQIYSSHRVR